MNTRRLGHVLIFGLALSASAFLALPALAQEPVPVVTPETAPLPDSHTNEEVVPPPPSQAPAAYRAPAVSAPVVYAPQPPPYIVPQPALVSTSERLPDAAPFMLGFGLSVLGTFALTSTSVFLANADLSGLDAQGGLLIAGVYLVSAGLAIGGLYMALGSLFGAVSVRSHQPGWVWFSAVTSLFGGLSTIAAVATYFADDEFGGDSIGFTIAAGGFYLATLTALLGLDDSGGTTVAVTPLPLREGGGVNLIGSF